MVGTTQQGASVEPYSRLQELDSTSVEKKKELWRKRPDFVGLSQVEKEKERTNRAVMCRFSTGEQS
mgnify:CR=1 FL=1